MLTKSSILNKVIMGISIPLLLGAITFGFNVAYSHVVLNWETAALAASNSVAFNAHVAQQRDLPQQIGRLQSSIDDLYKEVTTIQGVAKVGNFGGTEGYIQINMSGRASRYAKRSKARVTNITSVSHPSYILPIKGTYSDPNPECILRVSQKAARDMFEVSEQQFRVQIEEDGRK